MKHPSITLLSLMLTLGGCIEDRMDQSSSGEGLVPIHLTISPTAASTRTATTDIQSAQLASGQTFYAYFTSANVVPQSSIFTADGAGGTTPASQPYFKLSETSTDVRAYYPSSVTEGTTSFTVEADQSSDANYRASDLMFASANITKAYPTSTGALTFAHKMAKVRVQTTTRVASVTSIKLKSILPSVPFTASTGALGAATGSATDITMYSHSGQTSNIDCVALIPPQTMTSGTTLIEITTALHSSTPLTYQLPANITFASGQQYVFNVDLHEEQLVVTYTVFPWSSTTTNSAEVDVKRPTLPIEYVAPYNMGTATSFATDNTPEKSMYFSWNNSTASSGGVGTPSDWSKAKADIKAFIQGTAVPGYHLPSKAEWCSVVAPYYAGSNDTSMSGADGKRIVYKVGQNLGLSETVAWGVTNVNGTYTYEVSGVFYNDYNCPNDAAHETIGYGLRFKDDASTNGEYTCAYRYEYKASDAAVGGTNHASLTIKVTYVGADAGVTIATISNESWWATCDYTLVLPACGYSNYTNGCNQNPGYYSSASSPAYGFYWSATARDASLVHFMFISPSYVYGNGWHYPGYGFSVRLFKDK